MMILDLLQNLGLDGLKDESLNRIERVIKR